MALPVRQNQTTISQDGTPLTTAITCSKPAGTVVDDYLIAALILPGSAVPTPPSGWTQIARPGNSSFYVYVLRCGSSEPASYTWNLSAQVNRYGLTITRYSGVNNSGTGFEGLVSARTASGTAVSNNTATTGNDRLVVTMTGDNPTNASPAPSFTFSGSTEVSDLNFGIGLALGEANVGKTVATPSVTVDVTSNTTAELFEVTLALLPLPVNATVTAVAAVATASRAIPSAGPGVGVVPSTATATFAIPPVITGNQTILAQPARAVASRAAPHPSSSRMEIELDPDVGGTIELVEDTF